MTILEPNLGIGSNSRASHYTHLYNKKTFGVMNGYINPLSIFFIWHPRDDGVVGPVFEECFVCLRRDVERPFSRSVNVPVFVRTCAEDGIPAEVTVHSKRAIIFAF